MSIERWLSQPFPSASTVVTPYDSHVLNLYDQLRPLVICDPPEQDWLGVTHILRNKVLHFGQSMLRQVGLHDTKPEFYLFIPRQWPFIYERYLRSANPNVPHDPIVMRDVQARAGGEHFSIGIRSYERACSPGADVQAIWFRASMLEAMKLTTPDMLAPWTHDGDLDDAVFQVAATFPMKKMAIGVEQKGLPLDVEEFVKQVGART